MCNLFRLVNYYLLLVYFEYSEVCNHEAALAGPVLPPGKTPTCGNRLSRLNDHAVYSMLAQSAIRAMALIGRGQERRNIPGAARGKAEIVYCSTLGKELDEISWVIYTN